MDNAVPLSAQPFHLKGKTMSHSWHLKRRVLWPQQKSDFKKPYTKRLITQCNQVSTVMSCYALNTLPLGHVEWCDCSPMCCWQVTSIYVSLHNILHMRLSAHFSLQGYRQLDAGCLGLKLQINRPFMTPYF